MIARSIYQIARADFLERTRTFQYLALVALTLWAGVLCVPARSAHYVAFSIDGYRGIYNSAWMGVLFAIMSTTMLSLIGFYLVRGSVQRDRHTRVGDIIASTSAGKFAYVLGKTLSNAAVLTTIAALLVVDAVVMQFVRGEDRSLDLFAIVTPMLVFVLPVIAIVSAAATLFDVLPVLRGGAGNVAYFFIWIGALTAGAVTGDRGTKTSIFDAYGFSAIAHGIWQTLSKIDHRGKADNITIVSWDSQDLGQRVFLFHGMPYTGEVIVERLSILLAALALVVIAAVAFDRFASSSTIRERREPRFVATLRRAAAVVTAPLLNLAFASSFGSLLLAELRLLLKGSTFWWYAVAAGLWVWTLVAPAPMQSMALGVAWIWPILIWSQLGARETIYQTQALVYPSLHPLRRQFAAQLCAGILFALILGSGAIAHDIASGNPGAIAGVLAGACFIPSLALACGAASGATRLFEIVMLVLWYIGPLNATALDYTAAAHAPAYTVAGIALAGIAFAARRARLAAA